MLFIGELLLQLIRLVLVIGLLRSDVETTADQRIGINVVDDISIHPLHEFVRRQAIQHRLALRRIGRADNESGG